MRSSQVSAAVVGAASMGMVGASLAVSTALLGYPFAAAQGVRYLVAAGLFVLVARLRRMPVRWPSRREAGLLVLLAATGLVGFNACVLGALASTEPAVVGVVVGIAPLLIAVGAPLAAGRGPQPALLLCAALVVGGVALVEGTGRGTATGTLWAVGALAGEVAFTLLAAPLLARLGPLSVSLHSCWYAGVALAVLAPFAPLPRPSAAQAGAAAYLAAMTVLAFLGWYTCVGRLGAERTGLLVGIMPVAALVAQVASGQTGPRCSALVGVTLVAAGVGAGLRAGSAAGRRGGRAAGPGRRGNGHISGRPVRAGRLMSGRDRHLPSLPDRTR
jgi:drug/metabolite transporter (DMT)-like permease